MDDWGTQIRLSRTRAGLTQSQLAELSGVAQGTISRVESGGRWPSRQTVETLLEVLRAHQPAPAMEVPGIAPEPYERNPKRGTGHGELAELNVPELLGVEPEPVDWIVEGFAARGAVTMLAGRYGQGKSLLGQSLAIGVAEAAPGVPELVAGFRVHAGRSLVLDAENGPALIHARLKGLGLSAEGARNLHAVTARAFDIEADEDALRGLLEAHRPDLVVLDTWTSLWRGSEASVEQVQDCLNLLRDIARDYGVAVILLHHTTKSGEGFRGSGAIGATIEGVFVLDRPDELDDTAARIVSCEKLRIAAEPAPRYFRVGYPLVSMDEHGDELDDAAELDAEPEHEGVAS